VENIYGAAELRKGRLVRQSLESEEPRQLEYSIVLFFSPRGLPCHICFYRIYYSCMCCRRTTCIQLQVATVLRSSLGGVGLRHPVIL